MESLHSKYKTQVTSPKVKTQLGCKQNSNILIKNLINVQKCELAPNYMI
jgi:hypothetical protein